MVISSLVGVVKALFHCRVFTVSAALGLCVICAVCGLMPPDFRHASLPYFLFLIYFPFSFLKSPHLNTNILSPNRKFRLLFWVIFTAKTIADGAGAEQSAAPECCTPRAGEQN